MLLISLMLRYVSESRMSEAQGPSWALQRPMIRQSGDNSWGPSLFKRYALVTRSHFEPHYASVPAILPYQLAVTTHSKVYRNGFAVAPRCVTCSTKYIVCWLPLSLYRTTCDFRITRCCLLEIRSCDVNVAKGLAGSVQDSISW